VERRCGTHGGVSDREATLVQSLQNTLAIVYFRGESYVHPLKVRVILDSRNVGQTGIRTFRQKLSIAVRTGSTERLKKTHTWFTRSNASSVINEFSTITG